MTTIPKKTYESVRKTFHTYPELSGAEFGTQNRITEYLKNLPNIQIEKIAQTGVLAICRGNIDGPSVLIRSDIDALPINEINDFDHKSKTKGVSHKCGHDGHTTIALALADHLSKSPPEKGQVYILFQPSEENGKGADSVLNDTLFNTLSIDWVFALHNIPGFELNTILLRNLEFTAEVKSMVIQLSGITSHAAEPEKGKSPAKTIAALLDYAEQHSRSNTNSSDFFQITPVHAVLGEKAYGVSPGQGEVHFTLRSWSPEVMKNSCRSMEYFLDQLCERDELSSEVSYLEEFSANINHPEAVNFIRSAAKQNGCTVEEMNQPFRWGEDFGLFTQNYQGAMFGIGAGIETLPLHNPAYDFPDAIIPTAQKMFMSIISEILK